MTTGAKSAQGVLLKRNGTAIAEMKKIGGIQVSRKEIDVTNNDSPDGYTETIPGMKDGGSVDIEGNFIPGDTDGQIGLDTDFEAGTMQSFTIVFPTALATQWSFTAFVKNLKVYGSGDETASFSATVRISGKPTLSITASADATTIAVSVGTLVPAWDADKYDYSDAVVAGTANLTFTVTHATAATITLHNSFTDGTSSLTTGVASGAQTLGAVDTITTFTITCTVTGKIPKIYTIEVVRAAS